MEIANTNIKKDRYGNRKRGDKWEGRISIYKQQVSLYDVNTRRLELRKNILKQKCEEFEDMEFEYKTLSITLPTVSKEYYDELTKKAVNVYHDIVKSLDIKRESKITDTLDLKYKNINKYLEKIKEKNPELLEQKEELTIKDWFYKWLWTYKYQYKANTTFRGYVSKTKNHIIRVFGDRKLNDITTIEVQEFINDLAKDYSSSTIRQIYLLLHEGLKYAQKNKLLKENPAEDIQLPHKEPKIRQAVDLDVEKKLICMFINEEMFYPFVILFDTGLRTSELCGLKWENINFKNKVIYVRQSYQRIENYDYVDGEIVKINSEMAETKLKSRTSKREIPMSDTVFKILFDVFNETVKRNGTADNESFVFINTRGNPVSGECLRSRLEDIFDKIGIENISLHCFRHTFATRLYQAKVKLINIQHLLGHSTVKMTENYLHVDNIEKTDSIEKLQEFYEENGLFNGIMEKVS